jgi:hypothetical protein
LLATQAVDTLHVPTWGTALLSMGGTGLGAAPLSYGVILYLRFVLSDTHARMGPTRLPA